MTAPDTSGVESPGDPGGTGHEDGISLGPERTQWFQLGVVCAASFVVWSGFGAILPYLPVFLQEQAHASVWLIGLVAAAYYIGSFAFAAIFGRLSDRIGRKPVIIAGVLLYGVATLLFITATHPGWFVLFACSRIGAPLSPAGQALVADLTIDRIAAELTAG
jgi:MFS family permease